MKFTLMEKMKKPDLLLYPFNRIVILLLLLLFQNESVLLYFNKILLKLKHDVILTFD